MLDDPEARIGDLDGELSEAQRCLHPGIKLDSLVSVIGHLSHKLEDALTQAHLVVERSHLVVEKNNFIRTHDILDEILDHRALVIQELIVEKPHELLRPVGSFKEPSEIIENDPYLINVIGGRDQVTFPGLCQLVIMILDGLIDISQNFS